LKSGANFRDINRIKRLSSSGMSVAQISEELRIEKSVVDAFVKPVKKETPKNAS